MMLAAFSFRYREDHPVRKLPSLWLGIFCLLLVRPAALSMPASIFVTSFEGTSGSAPHEWITWGHRAAWSWDSSVGRTGARSLAISNSRWNVGWAGPSFSVDSSYASTYPCYVLTGWVRSDFATGHTYLTVSWAGPDGWICNTSSQYGPTSTNGRWVKLRIMALPPVGATSGQVFLRSDKNEGMVWFDDISVSLAELPVMGDKPAQTPSEGAHLVPYRCLIRDHRLNRLAGEARLTLAAYYAQAGKRTDARTELDSFIYEFPDSPRLAEARLLAAATACGQDVPEAEDMFRAVVAKDPSSPEAPVALMRLAYLHARKGEPKRAVQSEFLEVGDKYPDAPCAAKCLYRAAKLDLRDPPDFEAGLRRFRDIRQNSGDRRLRAEAMVEIGLAELQRFWHDTHTPDDLEDALHTLNSVRLEFPDQGNSVARAELRVANYRLYTERNPEAARQILLRILNSYPDSAQIEVKYQVAHCSFAEKNYQDAIDKCAPILADPDVDWGWRAMVLYWRAHIYRQLGDYETARTELQSVIDQFPGTDFARAAQKSLSLLRD